VKIIWEGYGRRCTLYFQVLSQNVLGRTTEIHENRVKTAGFGDKNLTPDLPITKQQSEQFKRNVPYIL
jgi:hypothetical protein